MEVPEPLVDEAIAMVLAIGSLHFVSMSAYFYSTPSPSRWGASHTTTPKKHRPSLAGEGGQNAETFHHYASYSFDTPRNTEGFREDEFKPQEITRDCQGKTFRTRHVSQVNKLQPGPV